MQTGYTYDECERVTQIKDANGNITEYEYDANGRLVTIIQPNGLVEKRYVYDAKGRLLKEIDAQGYQFAQTDEEQYGTQYTYNALSWLIEKREPVSQENGEVLLQPSLC